MTENPPEESRSRRTRWRDIRVDFTPITSFRDYRILTVSGVVSNFGSFLTYVAVPFQIKELTGSALDVGLLGATELVPLVVCGLWGGALADAMDRRRIVVLTELVSTLMSLLLLANALLPHLTGGKPMLWPIYAMTAAFAAADGFHRPAREAVLPQLLPPDHIVSATTLQWTISSFVQITGPAVGGVLVATTGPTVSYAADAATFLISCALLLRMRPTPRGGDGGEASLRGIVEGWRYARSRQELIGTYVVDIAAMTLAMPTALFPFLADKLHASWALGMLYAAPSVGSLLIASTSGWAKRVHRHGLAVIWAAGAWGAAIALAAATGSVWVVLGCLAAAGAADAVSGLFRMSIWNQTIPDALRGRLAGVEMLSYSSGPILGQVRAGTMAAWRGPVFSIGFGGLACVGTVAALAVALPGFRRYDARTDTHAVAVRAERLAAQAAGSL